MTLRNDLVNFVAFVRQRLTLPQVTALCQFIETPLSPHIFQASELATALNSVSDDVLDNIIQGTTGDQQILEQFRPTLETYAASLGVLPEIVMAFGDVFKMFSLVDCLRKLSILQLMKLHDVLAEAPGQEVTILQNLQQLLMSLDPMALQVLHTEVAHVRDPVQLIQNHLNLSVERFSLYRPIQMLLSLPQEDFGEFLRQFPTLQPLQVYQMVGFLRMQPFDVLEMRHTLVPDSTELPVDLDFLAPVVGLDQPWIQQTSQVPNYPIRLKIVEQPPEHCIYRRNVKPNPVLMLVGDETLNDGNLYVNCTVVRCDEMVPEAKFLTGNAPIQISSGRLVTFRKLKIMVTSHQQNETLYLLKFDLVRRTPHNPEGEVLHTTFSNPITVLSHSTQLRPAASTVPVVREVIPLSGPSSGGTKVAILGQNFSDGPGTRVRFDNIDIIPTYHGGGTLVCHTPTHAPGAVPVTACNDPRRWSEQAATYTYESPSQSLSQVSQSIGLSEKFGLGIAETVQEAAWEGGYDQLKSALEHRPGTVNELDGFGFAALHYAAVRGSLAVVAFLLQAGAYIGVPDKYGNSPLHWATVHQHYELIRFLLQQNASVNQQNFDGATPLHVAMAAGSEESALLLLEAGASPNTCDIDACTPLHWAAVRLPPSMISLLVHYGGCLDAADEFEETPLFWALREENFETARSLLQYGANINKQNDDSETILHLVAAMGHKDITERLLEAGAEQVPDATGQLPLDVSPGKGPFLPLRDVFTSDSLGLHPWASLPVLSV